MNGIRVFGWLLFGLFGGWSQQAFAQSPSCTVQSPCDAPADGVVTTVACGTTNVVRNRGATALVLVTATNVSVVGYVRLAFIQHVGGLSSSQGVNLGGNCFAASDRRTVVSVPLGWTLALQADKTGEAVRVAQQLAGAPTISPAVGPGTTLVAWTQADVDAVRASSEATKLASQATLAAVQAQTVQAATTQAVLSAPAEQGRDWAVVGTLMASVLAGFVTAYRVV